MWTAERKGLNIFSKNFTIQTTMCDENEKKTVAVGFQKLHMIDCDYEKVYKLIQTEYSDNGRGGVRCKVLYKYEQYYLYCELTQDSGILNYSFYV